MIDMAFDYALSTITAFINNTIDKCCGDQMTKNIKDEKDEEDEEDIPFLDDD